jgi:hypothetical protein
MVFIDPRAGPSDLYLNSIALTHTFTSASISTMPNRALLVLDMQMGDWFAQIKTAADVKAL